ncbi:MAG: ROK family protein [Lachnospiraceae bacterium]|nr:ROK family protein [Lachnospiraceae bacterium]
MLLGGLECGGTKMVCAVGDEKGRILKKETFPSLTPEETMPKIIDFFRENSVIAIGIASFGPVDPDMKSPTYGYITSTTKVHWKNYNLLGTIRNALSIPCGFDTDVNGAVLGEVTYGCMKGLSNALYITVGTGIGIGVYSNGALLHGMLHPEGGHVTVRRHPDDTFEGNCIYHGDCLEGLASGSALDARFGKKAEFIKSDDPVWTFESYYLAQAIVNYILILSPEKIVMGGGVMNRTELLPMIRKDVVKLLNGYIHSPKIENIDEYITASALNGNQAVMGCMKLAYDAACSS